MVAGLRKAGILPQTDSTLRLTLHWMLQGPCHIVTCTLAELTGESKAWRDVSMWMSHSFMTLVAQCDFVFSVTGLEIIIKRCSGTVYVECPKEGQLSSCKVRRRSLLIMSLYPCFFQGICKWSSIQWASRMVCIWAKGDLNGLNKATGAHMHACAWLWCLFFSFSLWVY